jgi:hypothetical protein
MLKMGLHVPLEYFFYRDVMVEDTSWLLQPVASDLNSGFEWPTLLAACMPSVSSRFNTHPPAARMYSPTDEVLQTSREFFQSRTVDYYNHNHVNNNVIPWLKSILLHRVKDNGAQLSVSFNKSGLIDRLKASDLEMINLQFRTLLNSNMADVNRILTKPLTSLEELDEIVSTFNYLSSTFSITMKSLRHFVRVLTSYQ